jgi:GH24 family phage-related lysozyme (muramidase)/murein DD-endopeptidase MepM/ murein hydrolase activator NlpD
VKHSNRPRANRASSSTRRLAAPARSRPVAEFHKEEPPQLSAAASQDLSRDTLPELQRGFGNQAVLRMLAATGQAASSTRQGSRRGSAFDEAEAVAYNKQRFSYDASLVEQLNQIAQDRELYQAARAAGKLGPEFAQLVYAAQQVLFPGATNDGKLGPATLRTLRERNGRASTAIGLAANKRPIPERQVYSGRESAKSRTFETKRTGEFIVTGGFMEAHGHALKKDSRAIFSKDPNKITQLPDSGRNLGIDYVVTNKGKDVHAWYGGLVTQSGLAGGYGYRVTVETDVTYLFNGKEYPVFQAYGHNRKLYVKQGTVIEPGAKIAMMGGTGKGGAVRYGEHVDLRTWIMVDGKMVDVSPNLLDQQIASRRSSGRTDAGKRQPGGDRAPGKQRPGSGNQGDRQTGDAGGGGGGDIEEQMAFTAPFEGRRPRVYTDTEGHPTVGIGFNLDRSNARALLTAVGADYDRVRAGTQSLTDRQIDTLFRQDIQSFTNSARGLVSNFDSLPRMAQLVIVDMTFNLGVDGFSKFRKAIAAFERRDFRAAAEMQDSVWYGQVGRRSRHHVQAIRELAEAPQARAASTQSGGTAAPVRERRQAPAQTTQTTQQPTTSSSGNGRSQRRDPNAILSQIETSGASDRTARQDGHTRGSVGASERMARRDFNALKRYAQLFVDVGAETGLPPALLAAIASRESRGGTQLDRNGYGDHGNGFGLMQVDKRYHELAGAARSREHIEQAAGILKGYFQDVKAKFPRWSEAQQLRGAVAAYNFGVKNVQSLDRLDIGSTGDDYSADVWARARYYATLPEFGRGADTVATTPQVPTRGNRQQPPGQQTGSGRDVSGITVSFGPNANASVVSDYTLQVLKECLAAAGETSAQISSTSRTPADQARAMYNNIVARGVASQKALYGRGGDQVIDVYVASRAAGKDRAEILADMTAAIQRIGPSRVSNHCADPAVLGVIDVAPSSVQNKARFVAAVEADPRVSNFLHPGNSNDPAYHIEIPQR